MWSGASPWPRYGAGAARANSGNGSNRSEGFMVEGSDVGDISMICFWGRRPKSRGILLLYASGQRN